MDNRPVLFLDSGIGGLLYCSDFVKHNPQEEVCYLADTENFPYGHRSKEELTIILITLTEKLIKTINPKIIVLACNTATVSAIDPLRRHFPNIPFVGTVPAIKPAAKASQSGKIGVLGTTRTIEDPYNNNLLESNEKNPCEIYAVAAPELVEFVENQFEKADEKEKSETVRKYITIFRTKGADTLVLGCTHFLYLLDEFKKEAAPFIKVFDSLDGITKRIEFLLDENNKKLRTEKKSKPEHRLYITGTKLADNLWENRAKHLGFKLCFL